MLTQKGQLVFGFSFFALCCIMFVMVGRNSRTLKYDLEGVIKHHQTPRLYKVTHIHN